MKRRKKILTDKLRKYHFELKHLMSLFTILFMFQLVTTVVQKITIQNFLMKTQVWYQNDFVDRLANLSATSLELLLETVPPGGHNAEEKKLIIQAFNIVLTQQRLQHHVSTFLLLLEYQRNRVVMIDDGQTLYNYLMKEPDQIQNGQGQIGPVLDRYREVRTALLSTEQTQITMEDQSSFHVYVPLVSRGEYRGALYLFSQPEFGFVTHEIISGYNQTSILFLVLILLGFLGMFFISSQTVSERDATQKLLYREREAQLKKELTYQKESIFTKRIYHTHHKAEKIMGFIKEDLRILTIKNIEPVKARVTKYANFISRVIYDMKWFDPPLQAIRNPIFKTNLNEVIRFIVDHIFNRLSSASDQIQFHLNLSPELPALTVNEFVIWEVLEPLIQNCIDHSGGEKKIDILIKTLHYPDQNEIKILIEDNGPGISGALLKSDENGVAQLFYEHISTKTDQQNAGYGCYIAYEIAKHRCGWELRAENRSDGGARFTIDVFYGR